MRLRIHAALGALLLLASLCSLFAEEAPPPAKPGPCALEFRQVLAQWKDLLAELAVVQGKYLKANQVERADLQQQWKRCIAKGEAMQPKLIESAEKAFAEAPNADPTISELLVNVAAADARADNFEQSLRLAALLADSKCEDKRAENLAGMSALALADFDAAQKYLTTAKADKVPIGLGQVGDRELLDRTASVFLKDPAKFQQVWAKEKQLRDAEAKADDLPRVLLKTSKGDIELELFENEAPNTVANFISLVEQKFYDGLTFHRVMAGFMAQGGCPKGDGSGGPGYRITCECYQPDHRPHFRGSLSMAHAGRDTGGSQFFLTFLPVSHLDGKHTVFGRVTKGFDVLAKLQRRDPDQPDLPDADTIIEAKVLRKRNHEYKPETLPSK